MSRDEGYVLDMLEMARRALRHAEGVDRASFERDERLQDALIRVIQVLGEAARRVGPEFRAAHPEIPWTQIVGMRHKLVHDYFEVDSGEIWLVVREDLPALLPLLEALAPDR